MTGHDIARELERLGVPEGMDVDAIESSAALLTGPEEADEAAFVFVHDSSLHINMDHPRAPEAADLLLRAYRVAKTTATPTERTCETCRHAEGHDNCAGCYHDPEQGFVSETGENDYPYWEPSP
jgi:hypothetical protein